MFGNSFYALYVWKFYILKSVESIPVIHMLATDQQPIEKDGDIIGGVGG